MNAILSAIQNSITQYANAIVEKFPDAGIDTKDLIDLWNNLDDTKTRSVSKSNSVKSNSVKSNSVKSNSKAKSVSEASFSSSHLPSGCPYIYKKGDKQNTACGAKPRQGGVYCTAHKKYEGEEPGPKTVPSPLKRLSRKSSDAPPANIPKVIRTNKQLGVVWNPDTRMVFRSLHDRVVYARVVDGTVTPLTESDIETCKKWGFQYTEEDSQTPKKDSSDEEEEKKPAPKPRILKKATEDSSSEREQEEYTNKVHMKAIGMDIDEDIVTEEEDD
jgi:hypothetical protein